MPRKEVEELLRKYEAKIEAELKAEEVSDYSVSYKKFRQEVLAPLSSYERACKSVGKLIKIRLAPKDEARVKKEIEAARLQVEPSEVAGLAVFSLLAVILLAALGSAAIYLLTNKFPTLIFFLALFTGFFLFYWLNSFPARVAQRWKLKAGSQMVPCILYIVIYMRHTPNLERAIHFASEHLQEPLSLELKKIFWDVQTAKYATLKDALDSWLEQWREDSLEFVEAFHLIESSLYEPSEQRRIGILEKALEVVLDGVYEKMLHYSHDVKAPITNIYMLGIVLPTLGLALLPLASTLLKGAIKWYHVMIGFNVLVPFLVFYMTNAILAKRPAGFGETELLERNPAYASYRSKKPYWIAFFCVLPLFLLGVSPFIFYAYNKDYGFEQFGLTFAGLSEQKFFDFRRTETGVVGPFGLVALILSLFVPLSIALFFSIVYKLKTKALDEVRRRNKELEAEFASSIFQLGNRLADGIPAEMAFGRVAWALKGTPTAGFYSIVDTNIKQAGMSVEEAIYNKKRGALNYFPSSLVRTSMRILIESVKKGLNVASRALMAISTYVKNIHKVNERMRDLLADIASGMRSNMSFLAPLLAAVVVGLASMITMILSRLNQMIALGQEVEFMGMGAETITSMFNVVEMIPPYWLQIVVGIYIIEIVFILTSTLVTIEAGEDRLGEKVELAKNLSRGITLYFLTALIAVLALTALALVAVGGIAGGFNF